MANLNKVMLIGRLTRDPEVRAFSNGGKVAKFGFAVNNKRKNPNGEWEDEPVFIDIDVFNRGDFGKLADRAEQYLRKGQQIFIEGHLKLDQWTSQDGQKRSKLMVVMDNFQFLEPRQDGSGQGEPSARAPRPAFAGKRPGPAPGAVPDEYAGEPEPMEPPEHRESGEEQIPF